MIDDFDANSYWEERLQSNWGLQAVGCIGYGENFNRSIYRVKAKVFRRAVANIPFNPANLRVLDIGSGTGFIIDQWLKLGVGHLQGADLSQFAVNRLQDSYPELRFHQVDIGSATFAWSDNSRFDCISIIDVLYHIVEDDAYIRALQNLSSLLGNGGYLILSDNFLHGRTMRTIHQVSHTLDTLGRWLEEAGFRIVWRRPQYVLLNYPVDSTSRLLQLWWRDFSYLLVRYPSVGEKIARGLVPLELVLTQLLKEGPTTEMVVCEKID